MIKSNLIKNIYYEKKFCCSSFLFVSLGANAQLKKDGTPDMRYKANKETYGNSYSSPSQSTPSYSAPKTERTYENGGSVRLQKGYTKSNGTYVAPHVKTRPDNKTYNNLSSY